MKKTHEMSEENKQTKGKKNWNLINLKHLEGLVDVREYGVKKYPKNGVDNWITVDVEECFNALKRHIVEMDELGIFSEDQESGLLHLNHCLCNIYFMIGIDNKRLSKCE